MSNPKFRAWTGTKMIFKSLLDQYWFVDDIHLSVALANQENEIISVQQNTNYFDKNNKEIYDGDIIKVGVKSGFNSELLEEFKQIHNLESLNGISSHFIGIVKIDLKRGLMFENIENGYQEPMFSRHIEIVQMHLDIEIIGNIYQNPEMLQKKNPSIK